MKHQPFGLILFTLLLGLVLLAACADSGEVESTISEGLPPTSTAQTSSTSVPPETKPVQPTLPPPTETATIVPTATVIPPTQTPTLPPTETVTPTPLPTLPPDETVEKVLSLLQDNQNPDCLLPCWWGAIPGQTNWHDIEPFLRSVAINISERSKGAEVKMPLPDLVDMQYPDFRVFYGWNEAQIIGRISVDSMNIPGYDPKTMMTLYGIPDEVWMKTFDDILPGDVLPFQLIMIYQELGISFHYYVSASRIEDTVTVCFEPGIVETERPDLFPVSPRIRLWEPGLPKTIDEVANTPDEIYFPLEEKTDLTPQTFYEKFTNPNESPCIDTPSDLWKY